jgi:hypothetical protein
MKIRVSDSDPVDKYFLHYRGQLEPQDVYIEVSNGEVTADVNGEIGNAVPIDVHLGKTRRIRIPCELTPKAVIQIIEEHREDFEIVAAGIDEEWCGRQGNYVGVLTPDAKEALSRLENILYEIDVDNYPHIAIEYINNLCCDDDDLLDGHSIQSNTTDDELEKIAEDITVGIKNTIDSYPLPSEKLIIVGLAEMLEETRESAQRNARTNSY